MKKLHLFGLLSLILIHSTHIIADETALCTYPDASTVEAPAWICNPPFASAHFTALGIVTNETPIAKLEQCKEAARLKMAKNLEVSITSIFKERFQNVTHETQLLRNIDNIEAIMTTVMDQLSKIILGDETILVKQVTRPNGNLYCLISLSTDKYHVALKKMELTTQLIIDALVASHKKKKNIAQQVYQCTFPDAPNTPAPEWVCNQSNISGADLVTLGIGESSNIARKKQECLASARVEMEIFMSGIPKNAEITRECDLEKCVHISYVMIEQVTKTTLFGTNLKKLASSPNGILYCLVAMEVNKRETISESAKTNRENKKKALWQKFQAKMSIDEMTRKLEAEEDVSDTPSVLIEDLASDDDIEWIDEE